MDFLNKAISKLFYANDKGAIAHAFIAVAQELRMVRKQLGEFLKEMERRNR